MTSRRALLTGAAAGTAALALAGRRARAAALAPERRIGFALVGIGKLTQGQLIPALRSTKIARLTALVSGHADKAKRVAAAEGVPERSIYSYETFDRLADNPDVDVVYIVLPNSLHAEYTIRAARAGKHVYCEKPMAVTTAECDQMIAASKKAGRQLGIGYRLHFEPYNLELMRIARARELGALKFIAATAGTIPVEPKQWRLDKKLAGGGSMVDIGIYALQAVRYVSGEEPVSVSARQGLTDPKRFKDIDETLTFYRLPRQHHKHLKSTNMLERLNEEIRRRTHVVRIFPNGDSCLRLVRALAVETHENWLEQHRYLNMDDLREHKKGALRRAA